jgi:hypothetical protein
VRKLITALLAAVVVAGCSEPGFSSSATFAPVGSGTESPAVSPDPAASGIPTASLGPSPTAGPTTGPDTGTAAVYPPGSAVEVIVAELNLRETPGTGGKRVTLLDRGDVLVISPFDARSFGWGPVQASGYRWYPVVVASGSPGDGQLPPLPVSPVDSGSEAPVSGWVAASEGETQFLAAVAPRCPVTVDLTNVQAMLPAERLACFGAPITLEGTFGCGGCGGTGPGEFKPAWLASPQIFDFLSVDVTLQFGPVALFFHPDGPAKPTPGAIIRAVVHIDDARSTRCSITLGPPSEPERVDERTAVLYCRERFVVDSYEVLGTDPNFLGG